MEFRNGVILKNALRLIAFSRLLRALLIATQRRAQAAISGPQTWHVKPIRRSGIFKAPAIAGTALVVSKPSATLVAIGESRESPA